MKDNKSKFARIQTTVNNKINDQIEVVAKEMKVKKGTCCRILILEALEARQGAK